MISVMAGVVASAGLAGSIYNHIRITKENSEPTTNQNQQLVDRKGLSYGKNTGNEDYVCQRTQQFIKNKTDETFTQLYIWKC